MNLKIADLGISFAETDLVKAVTLFLIGCLAMGIYSKLDSIRYKRDKEIDHFISAKKHKEKALPPWKVTEP